MVFNCMDYKRDMETPKIHPTQKSIHVIERLISIFTDVGDVVIDPVAGSGITLLAAEQLGRKSYGFEIKKEYVEAFKIQLARNVQLTILQQKTTQKAHKSQMRIDELGVTK